jgi:hypothetical protein
MVIRGNIIVSEGYNGFLQGIARGCDYGSIMVKFSVDS